MPTNLVPKNTGSGSLGTDAKRWESINAITGSIDHISSSMGSLYVRGNITASGGIKADSFQSVTGGTGIDFNDDLTVSGDISAGGKITADTYTKIGNPFSTNYAGFAHVNHLTSTGYALLQSYTGETFINAETDKRIIFRIGNTGPGLASAAMVLTNGSLVVHGSIYADSGSLWLVSGSADSASSTGYAAGSISSSFSKADIDNLKAGFGIKPLAIGALYADITAQHGTFNTLRMTGSISASDISASGNIISNDLNLKGNLTAGGYISASGAITASAFKGDGSGLTGVTAEWDGTHTGNGTFSGKITADTNTKIGNPFSGFNYAGFANANHLTSTGYALLQTPTGETILNAETNKRIIFRIGNTGGGTALDEMVLTSGSLAVHCSISSSGGISANHITASGNISASGNIYMDETAGTDNSVVVLSSGKLVIDEIDSRVWGSTLGDLSADGGSISADMFVLGSDGGTELTDSSIKQTADTMWLNTLHLSSSGNITHINHITASGNISSSGDGYFGNLEIGGTGTALLEVLGNISGSSTSTGSFGAVQIGGANSEKTLTVQGDISASGDLQVDGDNVDFTNLPTSSAGANTGGLYKQTGAQLGLSFATSGSTSFVLIK